MQHIFFSEKNVYFIKLSVDSVSLQYIIQYLEKQNTL